MRWLGLSRFDRGWSDRLVGVYILGVVYWCFGFGGGVEYGSVVIIRLFGMAPGGSWNFF